MKAAPDSPIAPVAPRSGPSVANLVMIPWFLVVSAVNVVCGLLAGVADPAKRRTLWVSHYMWGRMLFSLGPLWRVRRAIPKLGAGPYIVVSNHSSFLDIPVNLGLPLPLRICARQSLFRTPLMGRYMRLSGHLSVDASSREAIEDTLASCRESIAAGTSILIFPEGTRSTDGEIGPFHKGAFMIARELGTPLLPVVIDGTGQTLPKGSPGLIRWFSEIRMRVLEPIDPAAVPGATRVLTRRVHEMMVHELQQLRSTPRFP